MVRKIIALLLFVIGSLLYGAVIGILEGDLYEDKD